MIRSFAWWLGDQWADAQPGDVRTVTYAIRCIGPQSFHHEMSLGFECIGIEATEAKVVLAPVEN